MECTLHTSSIDNLFINLPLRLLFFCLKSKSSIRTELSEVESQTVKNWLYSIAVSAGNDQISNFIHSILVYITYIIIITSQKADNMKIPTEIDTDVLLKQSYLRLILSSLRSMMKMKFNAHNLNANRKNATNWIGSNDLQQITFSHSVQLIPSRQWNMPWIFIQLMKFEVICSCELFKMKRPMKTLGDI